MEHQQNAGRTLKHWWNNGILAEQSEYRGIGIRTCEEQWNNVTTKQHQEVLPVQKDGILSR